jgi:hypothetical protein
MTPSRAPTRRRHTEQSVPQHRMVSLELPTR